MIILNSKILDSKNSKNSKPDRSYRQPMIIYFMVLIKKKKILSAQKFGLSRFTRIFWIFNIIIKKIPNIDCLGYPEPGQPLTPVQRASVQFHCLLGLFADQFAATNRQLAIGWVFRLYSNTKTEKQDQEQGADNQRQMHFQDFRWVQNLNFQKAKIFNLQVILRIFLLMDSLYAIIR